MMRTNDEEVAQLFLQAERKRTCLVPSSRRIREYVRRQCENGKVVRPARGMYARSSYWGALPKSQQALHVMRSLQGMHPRWTFCHESAALAFGLPVSYERLAKAHVATSRAARNASSRDVQWHVVEGEEPVVVHGLRVTSLARTVFDCMRTVDFKQALAVADGALRASGEGSGSFVYRFRRFGRSHEGAAHAVRTMYCADALSESGGESIARATMIQQGFALPELQVPFPRPSNRRRSYRVDFLWTRIDGSKVIGELDGMQKYEGAALLEGRSPLQAFADERHREAELTLYGMPIVRFSCKDVMDERGFMTLLERYGIPRSEEAARLERRLARSRSASACLFTVCTLGG